MDACDRSLRAPRAPELSRCRRAAARLFIGFDPASSSPQNFFVQSWTPLTHRQSLHQLKLEPFPNQPSGTISPPSRVHEPSSAPSDSVSPVSSRAGAGAGFSASCWSLRLAQNSSVHARSSGPSHPQELHEFEPVSLPDQPTGTNSPPVSVQPSSSAFASPPPSPSGWGPQKASVHARSSGPSHPQELHEFEPVSSPDQPTGTNSPPVSVQPSSSAFASPPPSPSGWGPQKARVHAITSGLEHMHELHQFEPVSLPDQPTGTNSPPVSVQPSSSAFVLPSPSPSGWGPQKATVHAMSSGAPHVQALHQFEPVSSPDQPTGTNSPPVRAQPSSMAGAGAGFSASVA